MIFMIAFWILRMMKLYIQNELSDAYQIYANCNYTEQEDTLMCSIHGAFSDNAHNCIGCNMEDCSKLILTHLMMSSKQFYSAYTVFPGVYISSLFNGRKTRCISQ